MAALGDSWTPRDIDAALSLMAKDGKFPAGRARSLPPDLVSAIQRERMVAAMLWAVSEHGYRNVSVQLVLERAGVSRPTFYRHFANKEDCFLQALDTAGRHLLQRLATAAEAGGDSWRRRLRFGLEDLLLFAREEPHVARALIVEARGASPAALQRRDALLDELAHRLEEKARELLPNASTGSSLTAAGIVGGIESLLYSRLHRGRLDELDELLPSLMYFTVLAYEGHEAASTEMDIAED